MDAANNRELAANQPAAQAAAIEQKNEKKQRALELFKKLPRNVQNHALGFADNIVGEKRFNAAWSSYKSKGGEELKTTLCSNCNVLFADQLTARIAHNLLWQIDVEGTLALAAQHPESLLTVVEIKDPHGQRVRGTPLQIVKAAGDRNTREMKGDEKPYGLVERLLPCFKDPKNYYDQLAAWDKDSKAATEKTMAPYRKAIETLCRAIAENQENVISDAVPFEELLKLPIVEEFRKALTPNPNHVVTSGSLFDMQIFLDFFAIWEANINNDKVEDKKRANLDGWYSLKSDLFAAIVYPALQARCERCDYAIFKTGIGNVSQGQGPDRFNFSNGIPEDLAGFGASHCFGFYGDKLTPAAAVRPVHAATWRRGARRAELSKIVSSKNINNWNYAAPARSLNESMRDPVVALDSRSAAIAPSR